MDKYKQNCNIYNLSSFS